MKTGVSRGAFVGKLNRRIFLGLLVCLNALFMAGDTLSASNNPASWPNSVNLSPQMEGWPNALRLYGQDRYQTSLATGLSLRGNGGFPYASPATQDSQSSGVPDNWWGVGKCPRSIILVAGDSPADALSATALSDPTGRSSEPYLRRSQGADLLFDPVGGYKRVDTNHAPVLVTESARRGATALTLSTKFMAQDLRSGGCISAREAIIVGGYAAVPEGVDLELVAMGYNSVYRVSGNNRFATASAVAASLGTSSIPNGVSGCTDGSSDDGSSRMTFYANSVVEWRESAVSCQLLGRTVVLTDGLTGADALAAGWWTAFWQVPVLLHNGTSELPEDTKESLQTLNIENLIILGGESRIAPEIADLSAQLTGAEVWRVAGVNRYETSVKMAEIFGGWWSSRSSSSYASSLLCVAGSFGSGARSIGWPDALGAGAWCASASGGAANTKPPVRFLQPVAGNVPQDTENLNVGGHDAIPVILVRAGSYALPVSVKAFFDRIFPSAQNWCSSREVVINCVMPGFAVIFGGPLVVTEGVVSAISAIVGGDGVTGSSAVLPVLSGVFPTKISQQPVYREVGIDSDDAPIYLCVPRGSYEHGRWLTAGKGDNEYPNSVIDLMSSRWYLEDGDGVRRSYQLGAPGCIGVSHTGAETVWLRLVGLDGKVSEKSIRDTNTQNYMSLTGLIVAEPPSSASGLDSSLNSDLGEVTAWDFESIAPPVNIELPTVTYSISRATVSIDLTRGNGSSLSVPNSFTALWKIRTAEGTLTGRASGEALLTSNGVWNFRGISTVEGGDLFTKPSFGGFEASLETKQAGLGDDRVAWRLDAFDFR